MKFTPRKNAFTTGILGILVSVFFLSPISMSLTRSAVERGSDVPVEIGLSYRVSEVYAQNMPSDGTENVPDGSTNNTSYQNFPYANDDNTSISNTSNSSFQNTQNPFGPNTSDTTAYPINGNYTSVNDPNYAPSIDSNISNGPPGTPPDAPLWDPVKQAAADQATQGSPEEQTKANPKNPPVNEKTEQNKVVQFLGNIILGIGAFFAMITGTLLDTALKNLVFGMGVMVNAKSFGGSITQMWTLFRDICNLLFIFGFIYLGIRTIIDPESATVKRTLARIIIGALLINFSLFIVKFVIDVSNFTALKIFQAMTNGTGSISGVMFHIMGLSSYFSPDMKPIDFTNVVSGGFWFYVMGALLFIVAAVTFAIAAVMLVVRFVVLIFLMLGAPLLFAAPVFPQLESIASSLWKKLFSNAFFAPVYLLLVLISIKLMEGLVASMAGAAPGGLANQLGSPPTSVDGYSIVFSFIIMIFFLIQSLTIAKKMGAVGGDTAVSAFHGVRKSAQGYAGRAALRAGYGKYTVGGALDRLQKNTTSPTIARVAGSVTGAKFGSSRSYSDTEKEKKEFDRRKAHQEEVGKISSAVAESARMDAEYARVHAPGSGATQAQKDTARTNSDTAKMEMEQAMNSASTEQTLALLKKHKGEAERSVILGNLSASQFDGLMKVDAEKLDDSEKNKLRQTRSTAVQQRLVDTENRKEVAAGRAPTATIASVIGKADAKDIDAIGFDEAYKHAGRLTSKQIDDMSLSTTAKARLKDKRKADLITEFNTGGAGAGASTLFGRITSETERAKLPGDILKDSASAKFLTQGVLTKMLDNDSVEATDRATIKGHVETVWATDPAKTASFKKFFKNTPAGQQYV